MTTSHQLFIGGKWVDAANGASFVTVDPATERTLATCAEAGEADVNSAVAAARAALADPSWSRMSPDDRGRLLWRIATLIEDHGDELARLETLDQGQHIGMSTGFSVRKAAEHFRYFAGWCTKIEGATATVSNPDVLHYTRREPVGVCGLITPCNFPLLIAAWKLAPALACGNTAILKPAEQTPLTTVRLAQLCDMAGVPDGVVNLLTGGVDTGWALVNHPGVDKISFTGSTANGRKIGSACGESLKRVTLELGGKAPSIIAADADIDAAVLGCLHGGLLNSGQACAAYTRFYVHERRAVEFTEKLARAAGLLRVGSGIDPATEVGPLVSVDHLERVDQYVHAGIAEGAELVAGGHRAGGDLADGYFYQPTVFADVQDTMSIARDEIFGPVLSVLTYSDTEEIAVRANETEYGLSAAVWTRDLATAHRAAAAIRAGLVYVNMVPMPDAAAPWGGFKASGPGREMGPLAIEAYTETKGVWLQT